MKKILFSLLAFAALTISSCSDVAEDDRYLAVESVAPQRAVLIEDFTGQNCVNCPDAHKTIDKLVEQYGDAVIPVSIHAGKFGIEATKKIYTGLMQPEGNTYNDAWGILEWPKGVVNRRGGATNHDTWAETVRQELAQESKLGMVLSAKCSENSSEITVELNLTPTADINAKLQLWVLESGIVARQKYTNPSLIQDYVHNHVYRASINGIGGEDISLSSNIHKTMDFTQTLRSTDTEKWVPENLTIVAFVYDATGVLQATQAHVVVE